MKQNQLRTLFKRYLIKPNKTDMIKTDIVTF